MTQDIKAQESLVQSLYAAVKNKEDWRAQYGI